MCSTSAERGGSESGIERVERPARDRPRSGDDPGAELTCEEALPLAREFAGAHQRMIDSLRKVYKKDGETAVAEAGSHPEHMLAKARDGDPGQLSWIDLDRLAQIDPALALRRWNEVKKAAAKDLETGHRAARALEAWNEGGPYQRAEFIALRHSLAEQWRPRGGMEWLLIDKLAQASTEEMRWLETAVATRLCQWQESGSESRDRGRHVAPRMSLAASTDQAMAMADRWNRIFCRTLRALRDLRRYAVTVNIAGAGQVNIGSP